MMSKILFIISAILLTLVFTQSPLDDIVTQYFDFYPYQIFSGDLTTNYFGGQKTIHYVYYQSQRDHQKDPLILWLTGGPGCSGMATMMQQNGPLRIEPGTMNVTLNENAWNKRANLLYFEMPAGVGYSSNMMQDQNFTQTDASAAKQALTALNIFFNRFNSLKKNTFYIGGSGYAANYVSNLAKIIIQQNEDQYKVYYDKILLKGLLYGNPCIYPNECFASGSGRQSIFHYQFLYKRGYYPKSIYYKYLSKCGLQIDQYECFLERQSMDKNFNATNTSAYNIYSKCYFSANQTINDRCEDEKGILNFFNTPEFKQYWNIKPDKTWEVCNKTIWQNYLSSNGSYHILPFLMKKNIRIWIYSGDLDSSVPTIGTQFWINRFREQHQIPIKRNWRQWWVPGKHKHEDQVGGYIWEFEGMNFVSVKGAGFKASFDQPIAMEEVLNGFLDDKTLPYKSP